MVKCGVRKCQTTTQLHSKQYDVLVSLKAGTHWRQSWLLPKPATNRQQSRLLPIRSTLLPVCTGL